MEWNGTEDWVLRIAAKVSKESFKLKNAKVRYKRNFDKRMRRGNEVGKEGYYVCLEVQDGKG